METDELKAAWYVLHRELERQQVLTLRTGKIRDALRALRPLRWSQYLQLATGLVMEFLFAPVWFRHRDELHLLLPALSMHIYGLLLLLSAVRSLYLLGQLDYASPVLELQQRLADLRLWRVRLEQPVFALLGCFLWIPFLLVVFQALGLDLWRIAPKVLCWLAGSGFVAAAVFLALMKWKRNAVEKSFAGQSIRKAQAELDAITRFSDGETAES